jgi:hypothetical protein
MMGKVLSMLGLRHITEDDHRVEELDRRIQQERQLARLARSELVENVFQTVADDARRSRSR